MQQLTSSLTSVYYYRATPGRIKKDHWQVPRQGAHHLRKGRKVQIARQRAKQVSHPPFLFILTKNKNVFWFTDNEFFCLFKGIWPPAIWQHTSLDSLSASASDFPRKTPSTSLSMAGTSLRETPWCLRCTSSARTQTASCTSPTPTSQLLAASESARCRPKWHDSVITRSTNHK